MKKIIGGEPCIRLCKKQNPKPKREDGITLIALVITIIVLLILAGVVLKLIAGGDGILGKAEKAVEITNDAMIKEDIQLAIAEKRAEYYADYNDLIGTYLNVMDYIKTQFKDGKTTNAGAILKYNETTGKFEYIKDGQMIEVNVDENGNVSFGDTINTPEKPVYTVTYDANGGNGVPTDSQKYVKGATVTLKFDTTPTRDAYTFLGWTDDASDKNTAKYASTGTTTFEMGEKNITLYAVWKEIVQVNSSNAGDYVNLETNLLDRTIALSDGTKPLTDWRIFCKDGDNVWLIMSDYLPYSYETALETGLLSSGDPYNWKSGTNRDDLITRLKDESVWKKMLPTNLQNNSNVKVTGALEIETWVKAWNESGGEHLVTSNPSNGYLISIKDSGDATDYYISGLDTSDTLFFPHTNILSNCYGYWLASPAAFTSSVVMSIHYLGWVDCNQLDCSLEGVRPAVCIPFNLLEKGGDGIWKLTE